MKTIGVDISKPSAIPKDQWKRLCPEFQNPKLKVAQIEKCSAQLGKIFALSKANCATPGGKSTHTPGGSQAAVCQAVTTLVRSHAPA